LLLEHGVIICDRKKLLVTDTLVPEPLVAETLAAETLGVCNVSEIWIAFLAIFSRFVVLKCREG
jgi:hypothetical protein